ncbi:MAG: GGDEF domain-containing protein [Sulfurimonas sp.]
MKYKSLRTKILLIVITLTLLTLTVTSVYNYKERRSILYNVSIEKLLILTKVMNIFKKKQIKLYKGRFETLQYDKKFIHFIKTEEKNALKSYTQNIANTFIKSTPNLTHLHIYDSNGLLIIDYNNQKINDEINIQKNSVLKETIKTKKLTTGYVVFQHFNYYYSIISPIKEKGSVIAYVEFGINADNLFKIASKSGRYKYALFLQKNADKTSDRKIGNLVTSNAELFEQLKIDQHFIYTNANINKIVTYQQKEYLFYQFDIETPFQANFAQVLMASDITKYIDSSKKEAAIDFILSFLLLLIIYIIIYITITKLINKLVKDEKNLTTNKAQMHVMIDNSENLITLFQENRLTLANQSFLTFVDINNIKKFKQEYNSIDELFVKTANTYITEHISNNLHWIKNIEALELDKKIVAIKNYESGLNYFSVQIKHVPDQIDNYVVVFVNITAMYMQSQKNQYLASHDVLTKIYNRQSFNEKIAVDMQNQNLQVHNSSLLMFDLDLFKRVNDTYGHKVGDDVLVKFTQTITNNIRENDVFARWGGEEFVLLLIGTSKVKATSIANHLREKIEKTDFKEAGTITCSVGLSEFLLGDTTLKWLNRADNALYRAKENGRNRVEVE